MAAKVYDIMRDAATNELLVVNGDFVRREATAQSQRQLILNGPGDYKENPTIGVGAFDYLHDDTSELEGDIAQAFARDGMKVKEVILGSDGVIHSDAVFP